MTAEGIRGSVFLFFKEENKLDKSELFFVIGGDSADALTSRIDELSESGYSLQTIHWGAVRATSALSSSEWWGEAKKQFEAGAKVVAVLEPKH